MTIICSKSQVQEILSLSDKQIIADVLTWDMQQLVSPQEVEAIAIVHDIVWVKLTDNRAIPLHVETFRAIRATQLEQQNDVEYVMELEAKLEESVKEQIEIDSTTAGIYRIWKGKKLIGTVKRCEHTFCWLASSTKNSEIEPYLTSKLAILAVEKAGLAA